MYRQVAAGCLRFGARPALATQPFQAERKRQAQQIGSRRVWRQSNQSVPLPPPFPQTPFRFARQDEALDRSRSKRPSPRGCTAEPGPVARLGGPARSKARGEPAHRSRPGNRACRKLSSKSPVWADLLSPYQPCARCRQRVAGFRALRGPGVNCSAGPAKPKMEYSYFSKSTTNARTSAAMSGRCSATARLAWI